MPKKKAALTKCTHCGKKHDRFPCLDEWENRYIDARNEISGLVAWFEALAYYAGQPKRKRTAWYAQTLGGEPKSVPDLLCKIRDVVRDKAIRISGTDLCGDNLKSLYFCREKRGHRGKHTDGVFKW